MIQPVKDTAGFSMVAGTGVPQRFQMGFEMLERGDLTFHVGDVLFHQITYPGAAHGRIVLEGEQVTYFGQVHAVQAAAPDEVEAFDIILVVKSIIGSGAFRFAEQAFLFIITYSDDPASGESGEFSYFQRHEGLLVPMG